MSARLVTLALTAALVGGLLAGCGKKGAPEALGPSSEITYPRTYPTR